MFNVNNQINFALKFYRRIYKYSNQIN